MVDDTHWDRHGGRCGELERVLGGRAELVADQALDALREPGAAQWGLTPTGPDRVASLYLFVFGIDPDQAGFTRGELLSALRDHGCQEVISLQSLRPLHTLPALTEPRSPVTSYQQPAIRGPLVNSALLPACSAGVALPVDDTPASQRDVATLVTALNAALADLV